MGLWATRACPFADPYSRLAISPITYGKSEEHLHFPGSMTLTGEILLAMMNEIGESVYRAGFRKLLILNAHGGQPQVMEMCARELGLSPVSLKLIQNC